MATTTAIKDRVLECIYRAIEETNQLAPAERRLRAASDTTIFGDGGYDSISLVRFTVAVEEQVSEAFDVTVTLSSDKAFSLKRSPFRSIDAFADFVVAFLDGSSDG